MSDMTEIQKTKHNEKQNEVIKMQPPTRFIRRKPTPIVLEETPQQNEITTRQESRSHYNRMIGQSITPSSTSQGNDPNEKDYDLLMSIMGC